MTEGAVSSAVNTEYAPAVQEPAAPVTVAAAATPTAHTPRPGSIPPPPVTVRPDKSVAHGGPTRQFLNQNITPHLLEGMKYLAVYEPEKPLLWLSEFLKDRSKEVEGA
jgi:COMPASS component SDC1